jgi:hypothetical protein
MDNETGRACGKYRGRREVHRVLRKNLKERQHLEDLGMDLSIILKQTFRKQTGTALTGLIWLRIGTCEHGNEQIS